VAVTAKIGTGVLELRIDDADAKKALDEFKKRSGAAANDIRGISQAVNLGVFKELASVAADAFRAVATGLLEIGERGSAVDDVASTFETLTARTKDTAAAMLGELREGVAGTISDMDLMTMANGALGAGLVKSADDMGTLASGARALGESGLGTTKQVFETLMSAISSGRTTQLKQLGLFVDAKVATEEYAKAQGKTVAQLTDAERAQALSAATLEALKARQQELGPITADFGDLVERVKVGFQNFTDQIAVGVARSPVFAAGLSAAGQAMDAAFGGEQGQAISFIVSLMEDLAIGVLKVGRFGVQVGEWIGTAFQSVKIALNTVLAFVYDSAATVNDFLAGLADRASSLPVVGAGFAKLAQEMRAGADGARVLAQGFRDLATEQAADTIAMQNGFAAVKGAIDTTITAMQAAQGQAVTTSTVTKQALGDMAGGAGEAKARAEENVKAIADAYRSLEQEVALLTKEGLDKRLLELDFARQAEIAKANERKQATAAETAAELALIDQKYALLREKAMLQGDAMKQMEEQLRQEIALGQMTADEQKLAQIELSRQKEIAGIEHLKANYGTTYETLVALINQKYGQMTGAATGHFSTVQQAAAAAGFKTQAELQTTAERAIKLYEDMRKSGEYNKAAEVAAWEAAEKAKAEAAGKSYQAQMSAGQAWMQGTQQILSVLGEKHKAAAIAGALISTYQAVAKALASAPWPANLPLAAGALAAGMAQVNQIRSSQAGFAKGTPGLDFMNFGAMSWQPLHHEEAVIPRGGGHLLAAEIADSMPEDSRVVGLLSRIVSLAERNPREMRRAFREAAAFGV
jgi:AraC-like DNA-binding protein